MGAEMTPLSLERLLRWMRRERAAYGTVFGLHEDLFRCDLRGRPYALTRRGRRLESPLGVAAGPHGQLAQNLVCAWLCGARHLELKTIQERDDLAIARPCIDMADEGYNCEWSQELPLDVSCGQYLDAWTAIAVLRREALDAADDDDGVAAGPADGADPGFAMDLSVGYDLAGIRGARMQRCLDLLAAPGDALARRLDAARAVCPQAGSIAPPDRLCDGVTLSTMHGCPPEEIERIGRFLLAERGLHTTIKLNPTLLGREVVRGLLNGVLGYAVEVPDEAFDHDLAWDAAVDLIGSLRAEADRLGLGFGVKLTNTLACRNRRGALPASEAMVYMSGRALHPLAVRLAADLQTAFAGDLDISFAGGLDARNFPAAIAGGLAPATVCSDLLRPGGFQRLRQYLDALQEAMDAVGAGDLEAFACRTAGLDDPRRAALANLEAHARAAAEDPAYRKATFGDRSVKTARPLGAFDCIGAPCREACPAGQDVPGYMACAARGDFDEGLKVALRDNPLPTVTGMVCDHPCQPRCTRVNYEAAVGIRDVKRFLAHHGAEPEPPIAAADTGRTAAVVGAGPAGLSCAWYLTLAGVRTTVHEAKGFAGGMITDAIPLFRLRDEDFRRDLRRLTAAGVTIRTGERIDRDRLDGLRRTHDAVFVGIGAQADRAAGLAGEDAPGVWPALRFLSAARRGRAPALGREVAVIGGGNTAMDAARTALRLVEAGGAVHLVYRRTAAEMPAAREELQAIRDEGVVIHELLAPLAVEPAPDGRLALRCRRMRLGAPDASGRPRPEPIEGAETTLAVDAVIPAVGQLLETDLLSGDDLPAGAGRDRDAPLRTALAGVYAGGDALRGAATLIEAIADGRRAAGLILADLHLAEHAGAPAPGSGGDDVHRRRPTSEWQDRASRLQEPLRPPVRTAGGPGDLGLVIGELSAAEVRAEADRCLDCDVRCDVCVSVCPNRANLAYEAPRRRWPLERVVAAKDAAGPDDAASWRLEPDGTFVLDQTRQTANLIDFCNECGNCATFCPTAGAPYRDKPRLAVSEAAAESCEGPAYTIERGRESTTVVLRDRDRRASLTCRGEIFSYRTAQAVVELDAVDFRVRDVIPLAPGPWTIGLREAAAMAVLLEGLAAHPLADPAPEERT